MFFQDFEHNKGLIGLHQKQVKAIKQNHKSFFVWLRFERLLLKKQEANAREDLSNKQASEDLSNKQVKKEGILDLASTEDEESLEET